MKDRGTTGATVAVLEPGYADYRTEEARLAPFGARLAVVAEGDDAVLAAGRLNPTVLLIRERRVDARLMDACPNLRAIVRYGVGVDNIDLKAAADRKIFVANVPSYGAEIEVSEHALALYLVVQRRLALFDGEVRKGRWGLGQSAPIPDRTNAILGLVGCGRIGLATAQRFRALGFDRVLVHDPYLDPAQAGASGLEIVPLDRLCEQADAISLHAPLTEETRHMIGAAQFARMKPTTILVNVARGGLVDEIALAAALTEGRLFGAGVDVFETEPPAADNPLRTAPNCILTDHTAWYSERSVQALQSAAADLVAEVLAGGTPSTWLNRWAN